MGFRLSSHVFDSYREFYPAAQRHEIEAEVRAGLEIDGAIAARLVGRKGQSEDDRYILHRERTGLFVWAINKTDEWTVVTFLRFKARNQYDLATSLYPGGDAPTCSIASWLKNESEVTWAQALSIPEASVDNPIHDIETLRLSKGLRERLGMRATKLGYPISAPRRFLLQAATWQGEVGFLPHVDDIEGVQFKVTELPSGEQFAKLVGKDEAKGLTKAAQ